MMLPGVAFHYLHCVKPVTHVNMLKLFVLIVLYLNDITIMSELHANELRPIHPLP